MAKASGISLLQPAELDPLLASSYGTGEQVRAALDHGVNKIIIGMGGSATVDGGTGILKALGISFLNREGKPLDGLPGKLVELDSIDTKGLDQRILQTELVVLCDVENQLLGSEGSAAVFGPQKGATAEGVDALESSLIQFAEVTLRQTGQDIATVKHGGTAGGAAAGLYAFLGARLVNGIDYFLELTRFEDALQNA
jgi:glycerate kinase